jgi:hypothetical protein
VLLDDEKTGAVCGEVTRVYILDLSLQETLDGPLEVYVMILSTPDGPRVLTDDAMNPTRREIDAPSSGSGLLPGRRDN